MRPYTLDGATQDLITAVIAGDGDAIAGLSDVIDNLTRSQDAVSLHSAALWYAEQGLKVFPLQPGHKIPFKGSNGCNGATTDPKMIDAWWTGNTRANIGIATGHLVDVIDVDGYTGIVAIAGQVDQVRALCVGLVSTPRPGGLHYYLPHVDGRKNTASIVPGVDTRGSGGYVVAPPSSTDQGSYRWLRPLHLP